MSYGHCGGSSASRNRSRPSCSRPSGARRSLEREKISFNQLNSKTGNRIKYKKVDAATGEEVDNADIIKGYQFDKGQYVQVTREELEAVALDTTRIVEIVSFVPEDEIDELYYNAPYFITPQPEDEIDELNAPYFITPQEEDYANEAFAVIREALNQKGMVAIGRVVFGSREHMVAIKPRGNGMIGMTLHYPYEVRKEKEIFSHIPHLKIDKEMVGMAHQLIKSKEGHFEPDKFEDRYEDAVREILNKKQKGVTTRPAAPVAASGNVVNLMDALKKSLREGASTARRTPETNRAPAKKATRSSARARKAGYAQSSDRAAGLRC
jgi:DNA end-binding protein Ku